MNKGLCHVLPGTKFRVRAHIATFNPTDLWLSSGSQIHRTRQFYTFQSCVCEPPDSQLLCQQYLGTLRECFQLVSEWARERLAVGRQTIAFVISCHTAERCPLTSSLHFLQSSETAHPIDAGSSVARLVHSHAVESQSVGCSLEYVCRCKVIEIPDLSSGFPALSAGRTLFTH